MDSDYKFVDNFLYVKCEDSYLHLLKKVILSIKYIYQTHNIKEGILRCGDDLIFNEEKLLNFLQSKKPDYYGKSLENKSFVCNDINILKKIKRDKFMIKYYKTHKEDFNNPEHNLKNINVAQFQCHPVFYGALGVIFFISNKSCNILVSHFDSINCNIFHFDTFTKSYPYIIEDCGISFILFMNKIPFTNDTDLFDTENSMAIHTNKYR